MVVAVVEVLEVAVHRRTPVADVYHYYGSGHRGSQRREYIQLCFQVVLDASRTAAKPLVQNLDA